MFIMVIKSAFTVTAYFTTSLSKLPFFDTEAVTSISFSVKNRLAKNTFSITFLFKNSSSSYGVTE